MEFFFYLLVFMTGYLYHDFLSTKKKDDMLNDFYKNVENVSYITLGKLNEMHDYGLKALGLVCEKCAQDDPTKEEEYAKIAEVYERKMNEFGENYFKAMKQYIPYKMKYNTYKEVKENFNELINNKPEGK